MPDNNNSLISSLQGLIWSAIIGVASFQIIAPDVWGYIHDALAIPYKTAYWIFTLCYFLSLPVYMLIWLLFNKGSFAGSFAQRGLIFWFLFAFICVQTIGTAVTLRWPFPEWFYIGIFVTNVVCCGMLLVFYAKAAWRRIVEQHIRQYYQQLVLFTILLFLVLFAVQFVYLIQWESDKSKSLYLGSAQSSYYAGNRGFALLDLKDTLDDRMTALGAMRDSIVYAHIGDTAHTRDSAIDGAFTSYCAALIDLRKSIGRLSSELANPAREVLTDTIDSMAMRVPVLMLNGVGSANGTGAANGVGSANGTGVLVHYRADLREMEFLQSILQSVDTKVNAESQAQLGLQLRSVQIKGIILLVTLFFTMLSLYIYLSIDQRLESTTLDALNDRKRLGEDVAESALIDQEKAVAGATDITNSLWIGLTVIVWLLVPLFKPVTDADIDTREIYRMHTLNNFLSPPGGGGTTAPGGGGDSTAITAPGTK
jgi:hypothetical protein